ncbi:MAG: NADH:flavin oxidoreductase [Euryarchaeota archaeon]|nr:NADH:flavin oxidoreductase [Euryarchaeota archaeon]MBT7987414.1 NADH:flavin oxidoreductase [Euryarchaeota archaeon]
MKVTDSIDLGRGFTAKNRTLLAAMTNKQSNNDGTLSAEEIKWLVRRGQGGFGITTTAAANVTKDGQGWEGEMGVWSDNHIPGLTELAEKLNETGTISLVQLFHGGMRAPQRITGVRPISASENTESGMNGVYTKAMTELEIKSMIQSFIDAAIRCKKAGFHGIELHGAHSYLICQFLGQETNRRTDKWGGDITGRSRFLSEIIRSVRSAVGEDFLIAVRISPIIEKAGIYLHDSLELAKIICELEIDMLHISCWDVFQPVDDSNDNSLTKRFRQVIPKGMPLISTGAVWDGKDAQWLSDEGADIVGVARVGIAHPDWPKLLIDSDYQPQMPPFTVEHLANVDLSPVFIEYMKRWKNFVIL